jgi:hypothetical protein
MECASGQQDSAIAAFAHQTYIKPEPDDFPLEASTRVFLSEPNKVTQPDIIDHEAQL